MMAIRVDERDAEAIIRREHLDQHLQLVSEP